MSRLTRAIHRHHTEPGQVCSPRTPFHTIYDGHGSVRGLTDSTANLTDTYAYDAFGTITEQTGTTQNNYLYAGEQFDADLGFYYNRARYLNVGLGRFWSMDSYEGDYESPVSLHKYHYANASPVNMIDPSGNVSIAEITIVNNISSIISNFQSAQGDKAQDVVLHGDDAALTGFAFDIATLGISMVSIIGGTIVSKTWDAIAHGGWFARKALRMKARFSRAAKHYTKHLRGTTVEQAIELSHEAAQYLPKFSLAANSTWELEKIAMWGAIKKGHVKEHSASTTYFYHRFEDVVGYSKGKETRWVRVEVSNGTYHGHPRSFEEIKDDLRGVVDPSELME